MNKTCLLLSAGFSVLFSAALRAQDLNPVVEVSKSYAGRLRDIRKPLEKMAIPDSLLRFDLDFDYSVFEHPYKGAYRFQPYVVDIRPEKEADRTGTFQLRTGIGYALRPELEAVWAPKFFKDKNFKIGLYGLHSGFSGRYRNIGPVCEDGGIRLLPVTGKSEEGTALPRRHHGYALSSRAGADGSFDWKTGRLTFDLAYQGFHNRDTLFRSGFNAGNFRLRLLSKRRERPYFHYDVTMLFRLGWDKIFPSSGTLYDPLHDPCQRLSPLSRPDCQQEKFGDFGFYGTAAPRRAEGKFFQMDYRLFAHSVWGISSSQLGQVSATPKFVWEKPRLRLSLGAKLDYVHASGAGNAPSAFDKPFPLYPDFRFEYGLIRNYLKLGLSLTGGKKVWNYASLKEYQPFFNALSIPGVPCGGGFQPALGVSSERIRLELAAVGNVAAHFTYHAEAGYRRMENGLLSAVYLPGPAAASPEPAASLSGGPAALAESGIFPSGPAAASSEFPAGGGPWRAAVNYADYAQFYAGFGFRLDFRAFRADGEVRWNRSDFTRRRPAAAFEDSPFTGLLNCRYSWRNRLHAGVRLEFAAARKGFAADLSALPKGPEAAPAGTSLSYVKAVLPGYTDLGLEAEFLLNRRWTLRAKVDNLLNQTIQRQPLYPEGGIGLTLGICFNL